MHSDTGSTALADVVAAFAALQEAREGHALLTRIFADASEALIEAERRYAVAVALATRAAEVTP